MSKYLDWKRILTLVIAAGLLVISFRNIDINRLWDSMKSVNLLLLLASFASTIMMNWAKGMRWREIMMDTKKISKTRIFALFHVGQMINLSLPALTGQAGRIVMLSKQEGLSKAYCFTTVIVEVLFDGISLIVLMYLSSFLFSFPEWVRLAEIYAAIVLGIILLLLVLILRNERGLTYFGKTKIRKRFPRLYTKLKLWAGSFSAGLHTLKSFPQILRVTFYSLLVWIFHISIALTLIRAFDLKIAGWAAVVIIIANTIIMMFPVTPGNIGTFQFAVTRALGWFHVSDSVSAAFSIVMHFMDVAPVFLIGFIFLFTNHLRFRTLREETVQETRDPGCAETNPP